MVEAGQPSTSAEQDSDTRGLAARQALLVSCLGKLFAYAAERGYTITLGEGYVQEVRPDRQGRTYADGVHMRGSLHYQRLAQDLNLFVEGRYITDSEHFAWVDLGSFWEAQDRLCRSGRRFGDANHLSVTYQGKA